MTSRAMIVVAGGSSSRFGSDKLMELIDGRPLIIHTVEAVQDRVHQCVLVCRPDQITALEGALANVTLTPGGQTRTESEMAGLAALGGEFDLIGIHDGARPLVSAQLVDRLFRVAGEKGGAVPVVHPGQMLVERLSLRPVEGLVTVQTPQVFVGPQLLAAYVRAAQTDFEGQDTVDVVERFGDCAIAAVPGEPSNIKVTFPGDLETVRARLEAASHSEPR